MAWTKAKTAIVVSVAAILTTTTATVTVKKVVHPNSWADDPKYWQTDSRVLNQLPAGVFIFRPTRFSNSGGGVWAGDRMLVKNNSLRDLLGDAYGASYPRTVFPPDMPAERFDVMATVPGGATEVLKNELKNRFHLSAHRETRDTDVLLLKVQNSNPPNLKPHNGDDGNSSWMDSDAKTSIQNQNLSGFFRTIESRLGVPVLDETGLEGRYDLQLQVQRRPGETDKDTLKRALSEQLGLELVPSVQPVEMLIVEKTK